MEDQEKGKSILERIQKAGEYLGIEVEELSEEMVRLTLNQDHDGMRRFFNTYKEWEVRGRKKGSSVKQAEALASKNFDLIAGLADNAKVMDESSYPAFSSVIKKGQSREGGKITKFYRESVGYTPPPKTNS